MDAFAAIAKSSAGADTSRPALLLAPGPHGPDAVKAIAPGEGFVFLDSGAERLNCASEKCTKVLGRAARLPFKSRSFSAVVGVEVLFAIRPPWTVIAELHRVLAPNGKLILLEPAKSGLLSDFRARLVGPGRRIFALSDVKRRLERADFKVISGEEMPPDGLFPYGTHVLVAEKVEFEAPPAPAITTTREMRAKQKAHPGVEAPLSSDELSPGEA